MSAERTARAAVAAEQLCAALWEELHQQLRAGRSGPAASLGERIAEVSRSIVELASLERPSCPDETGSEEEGQPNAGDGALLVDEQADAGGSIAIRAARQSAQSGSWSATLQRRLDRYREDGMPFAVLLLELLDVERLRLAQSLLDAEQQVREVEAMIVEQLRPADALVREAAGRYWLAAPDTDAVDAKALAVRLGAAVRRSASHRGVPLELAVGIAVCPEHGAQEGALLSHAEVDLYAAQAKGQVVSDADDAGPAA